MRLTREGREEKRRAARAAAEGAIALDRINEFRLMAAWLWHMTFDPMNAAWEPAAIMAAYREWKRWMPFMHFFATHGVLHLDCPRPACRRARRCACDSMRCVRREPLSEHELREGRGCFSAFMHCMSRPEDESEQEVRGGA
jgi:hypothetical protein